MMCKKYILVRQISEEHANRPAMQKFESYMTIDNLLEVLDNKVMYIKDIRGPDRSSL